MHRPHQQHVPGVPDGAAPLDSQDSQHAHDQQQGSQTAGDRERGERLESADERGRQRQGEPRLPVSPKQLPYRARRTNEGRQRDGCRQGVAGGQRYEPSGHGYDRAQQRAESKHEAGEPPGRIGDVPGHHLGRVGDRSGIRSGGRVLVHFYGTHGLTARGRA